MEVVRSVRVWVIITYISVCVWVVLSLGVGGCECVVVDIDVGCSERVGEGCYVC